MTEAEKKELVSEYRPWPPRPPYGEAIWESALVGGPMTHRGRKWWQSVNKTVAYFIDLFIHMSVFWGYFLFSTSPDPALADSLLIDTAFTVQLLIVWAEHVFILDSAKTSMLYEDYETLYQKLLLLLGWFIFALLASYAYIHAW